MVAPLVAAAGIGLLGGLFQNSAASAEASKNRQWQEKMDNTKYQRTMTDMKAAGLNPMLAYSQGANSGAPSGAVAQQSNVADSVGKAMESSSNSAKTSTLLREQVTNLEADTKLKLQQGAAALEQAKLANANSAVVLGTMPYTIDNAASTAALTGSNVAVMNPKVSRARLEEDYLDGAVGKGLATAAIAGSDLNSASSALKNIPMDKMISGSFKALGF